MTSRRFVPAARAGALNLLLPAGLGALATLGFAPFGHYMLTWLALAGLVGLWWRANTKLGALRGFAFGLGLFGVGMHWPFVSLYQYGNVALPLAIVMTGLLVIYLALYPFVAGALAGAMRRLPRPLWAMVCVPAVWLLTELLRAFGPLGVPWLALGYTLADAPVAKLAAVGGVYLLSTLVVATAGAFVLLLTGPNPGRMISVALIVLGSGVLWLTPPATSWSHASGEPVSVTLIQGNFPQNIKWDPDWFERTLTRYRQLTRRSDAELVVWPETAIPAGAGSVSQYLTGLDRMARSKNQTVLVGVFAEQAASGKFYNTVLAIGAGNGRYDKRHLVPFGEYVPLPDFARQWLDVFALQYGALARGAAQQPPIRAAGTRLGVSICYEDTLAREVSRALPEASLLVNVTNDAWFAGTIEPAQHFNMARMRAVETGRPMIRATNTGISGFIGAAGHVIKRADAFEVAVLDTTIQPRAGTTPYIRVGNAPLWLAGFVITGLGLLAAGWLRLRATRSKTT